MAEYTWLIDDIETLMTYITDGYTKAVLNQAVNAIRKLSADVQPVRHGRWIWDEDGMDWGIGSWRCSECQSRPETWWRGNRSSPYNKAGHYYCNNCGAKMDGEAWANL